MSRRLSILSATAVVLLVTVGARHLGAAPRVTNISVRGLQIGSATTVVIDGADLAPRPHLSLAIPSADVDIRTGATDKRIEATIKLPGDVSPGIYPLRVCSDKGVSAAVLLGVDKLPQLPLDAKIEQLPAALHGRVANNQIVSTSFEGKKGQRIALDVEARRLGSPLEPVVRLYDARGAQIAWSPPQSILSGDARCEALLPANGPYTIELHDRLYRARAPGYFRLKVGDLEHADLPFPLGATAGRSTSLGFVSSSMASDFRLSMTPSAGMGVTPVDMTGAAGFSGPQPALIVSEFPELVERAGGAGKPQMLPQPPVAVSGRISAKGQEDVYHVAVKEGTKLRIEVLADRVGSPLDGVLVARRKSGQQVGQNDDGPGTSDPVLEVTVPKGENTLALALRDLRGEGGADYVYRLLVEEAAGGAFTLSTDADAINIPAGGTQILEVRARRAGVRGPIDLDLENLPAGITVSGAQIAAGDALGLVSLTAPEDAPSCGAVTITATAQEGDATIQRKVLLPETDASRRQPWLREQVAVATATGAPIRLAWADASKDDALLLGGSTPLDVRLSRSQGVKGKVRLRLATTQTPPKKTVKQRNRNVMVDDEQRTLRLEKPVELANGADAAEVRLAVPNDLKERPWSVAVVAELLSADGKSVVASAATPVRQLPARRAVELTLAGEAKTRAIAGQGGQTGTLRGTLVRMPGLSGPVTLTLVGLPAGYPAPKLEITAEANDFEFPVRFPATAKPAELKGVRLLATMLASPGDAGSTVKSNEIPVTLIVVKQPVTAAEKSSP